MTMLFEIMFYTHVLSETKCLLRLYVNFDNKDLSSK